MTRTGMALKGIIEQALKQYGLPTSNSVIVLLLMIAAHESGGFLYQRQVKGPAVGVFQMETPTIEDQLVYLNRTGKFKKVPRLIEAERVLFDEYIGAALARVKLWRDPKPLPDETNLVGLAEYAKRVWNTHLGKATAEDYLKAYDRHILGVAA